MSNAVARMSSWTTAYRKKRQVSDTPRLEKEAETSYKHTAITRNKNMWADFDHIAIKARNQRITAEEYKMSMAAIAVTLLFNSAQRPSAVTGMKTKEFHNVLQGGDVGGFSCGAQNFIFRHSSFDNEKEAERICLYVRYIRQLNPKGEVPCLIGSRNTSNQGEDCSIAESPIHNIQGGHTNSNNGEEGIGLKGSICHEDTTDDVPPHWHPQKILWNTCQKNIAAHASKLMRKFLSEEDEEEEEPQQPTRGKGKEKDTRVPSMMTWFSEDITEGAKPPSLAIFSQQP